MEQLSLYHQMTFEELAGTPAPALIVVHSHKTDKKENQTPKAVIRRRRRTKPALAGQCNIFDLFGTDCETPVGTKRALSPEEMVEANQGIVDFWVYQVCKNLCAASREDAKQEGLIALWGAAKVYDSTKNCTFRTYANTVVQRAMFKIYAKLKSKHSEISLEVCRDMEEEDGVTHTAFIGGNVSAVAEDSDFVRLLLDCAKTTPRAKERNGIKALAMLSQGFSSKEVCAHIGIAEKSFSAMVSTGRKALKSNPQLLNYISVIEGTEMKKVIANMLGDEYVVSYEVDAKYNYNQINSDEYLEVFAEFISDPAVADFMLDSVRYGERAIIFDTDNYLQVEFVFHEDRIIIESVENIRSKLALTRKWDKTADAFEVDVNFLGKECVLSFPRSVKRNLTKNNARNVFIHVASLLGDRSIATQLLEQASNGRKAVLTVAEANHEVELLFGKGGIQIISAKKMAIEPERKVASSGGKMKAPPGAKTSAA